MKIFLAAIESQYKYLKLNDIKVRNAFTTYYPFRNRGLESAEKVMKDVRDCVTGLLVCDSGAHSFFAEVPEKGLSASGHSRKKDTKVTADEYFKNYVAFLKRMGKYFDYFVELDIGELVGQDKVEEWRDIMKKEGLAKKRIDCFHPSIMDYKYLEKMCKESESKYIAVEGDRPLQRKGRLDYTKIIKIGMENDCKMHGFAMTKTKALDMFPFYSVDSTSWNAIITYGHSARRKVPKKLKVFENAYARSPKGKSVLFGKEVDAWNIHEDYYTDLWKKRGIKWK